MTFKCEQHCQEVTSELLTRCTTVAVQNAAVDASNRRLASSSKETAVQIAWLRHMACELLHAAPAGLLQEFQMQQLINFCLKVGSAQLGILPVSPPCPVLST